MLRKKTGIVVFLLLWGVLLSAQTKTVRLEKAGTLSAFFSTHETYTLTKLIVSGTIDACDFRFMRDCLPVLEELDIRQVLIQSYIGEGGTLDGEIELFYQANGIPQEAFFKEGEGMSFLQTIILPDILEGIGNHAFEHCLKLESVYFPSGIRSIGKRAFSYCENLSSLVLPEGVSVVEKEAFAGCRGILEITFPNTLTSIENRAFAGCIGITELVFPHMLKKIGEGAFAGCTRVEKIQFSTSLLQIEREAFRNCSHITTLSFPSGLQSIGPYAFVNNHSLIEVLLPQSLSFIGEGAFIHCKKLVSIQQMNPVPVSLGESVFKGVDGSYCSLLVPAASVKLYSSADQWKDFRVIGEGLSVAMHANNPLYGRVEGLEDRFFKKREVLCLQALASEGCRFVKWTNRRGRIISTQPRLKVSLSSDTMLWAHFKTEDQVCKVSPGMLRNRIGDKKNKVFSLVLKGEIDVRDIQYIRDSLPMLSQLNMKEVQIRSYQGKEGTLYGEDLYYPAEEIPQKAFYGKTNLQLLSLPKEVFFIRDFALAGCSNLSELTWAQELLYIGRGAFQKCSGLKQLELPSGVVYIGSNAFEDCSGISSLFFPAGLLAVEPDAWPHTTATAIQLTYTVGSEGTIPPLCAPVPGVSTVNYLLPDPPVSIDFLKYDTVYLSSAVFEKIHEDTAEFSSSQSGGIAVAVFSNMPDLGAVRGVDTRFYKNNERLSLTAVSKPGGRFVHWVNRYGKIISKANPLQIKVVRDTLLWACFKTDTALIQVQAGALSEKVGTRKNKLRALVVKGEMDARDFRFIRDSLPYLIHLDLREVVLKSYTGVEGSHYGHVLYYPENEIPPNAFSRQERGMPFLTHVVLPYGLYSIGERAFAYSISLGEVVFPEGLELIGKEAFMFCINLHKVQFSTTLHQIGTGAFSYCSRRVEWDLPPRLTEIQSGSFSKGLRLEKVILHSEIGSINDRVFSSCPTLSSVVNLNPNPPSVSPSAWQNIGDSCELWVPTASLPAYEQAEGWNLFPCIKGGGVLVSALPDFPQRGQVLGLESRLYQVGELVNLEAVSLPGFRFTGWSCEGKPVSSKAHYLHTVTEDVCLKANFEKQE